MIMIAAVNNNWAIGENNDLLYHISRDMKFFREKTKENVIIIGRKTLESFPNGKPLKNRINIVMTHDEGFSCDDTIIVHDLGELFDAVSIFEGLEVYVCGGAEIYKLLEPYCDTAYITKIDDDRKAQKYMPNLDEASGWVLAEKSEEYNEDGYSFRFCTYKNTSTNKL